MSDYKKYKVSLKKIFQKRPIAVFGASVTQQKRGYAFYLKKFLAEKVKVFGYGGMHLSDAGICFFDQVLKIKPSYCFLDWFSTGYINYDKETEEYLNTLAFKAQENKCKLIFLFFPHREASNRRKFEECCKEYLIKNGLYFIDVASEIQKMNIDLSSILRDNVHTNENGSKLYASIIVSNFLKFRESIQNPTHFRLTKYCDIKKIKVNKIFTDKVVLEGKGEIVGILVTLGPHSGMVKVNNNGKINIINTWDRWCHFPRKNFQFKMHINGKVDLIILQDNFDTSECKVNFDFTRFKKKLIIHDIFFVGDFLRIINLHEGKRIPREYLYLRKILGRVKQYTKNFLNFREWILYL